MNILNLDNSIVYILNKKFDSKLYYFLIIVTLLFFIFIVLYPYQNILSYKLYVDDTYKLVVDENYFPINENYLYINNKKYNYSILEIIGPYLENKKIYYEIKISINLKKKNNIIPVNIYKGKTTLFNKFINNMKGW